MRRFHLPGSLSVAVLLALCVMTAGCSSTHTIKVEIPAKVDLHEFRVIGILPFLGSADPAIRYTAMQRFMATIQASQPGIRMLELPALADVSGDGPIAPQVIKDLGTQHGIDAVLLADVQVSPVRKTTTVDPFRVDVRTREDVKAELNGVIRETSTGAIVWTNGSYGTWNLSKTHARPGHLHRSQTDIDAKYDKMINDLVRVATNDFRSTWQKREVPNE